MRESKKKARWLTICTSGLLTCIRGKKNDMKKKTEKDGQRMSADCTHTSANVKVHTQSMHDIIFGERAPRSGAVTRTVAQSCARSRDYRGHDTASAYAYNHFHTYESTVVPCYK